MTSSQKFLTLSSRGSMNAIARNLGSVADRNKPEEAHLEAYYSNGYQSHLQTILRCAGLK
jgi:hypothetical protein